MRNSKRRIALASILILLFQISFLSFGSAEDWTQTTQSDFEAGTINQVDTITDPGSVRLPYVWGKYPGNSCTGTSGEGCVLDTGNPGSWNRRHVFSPEVIYNGTTYKMWYTGADAAEGRTIGYATSSNGINWTEFASNPVFLRGSPGDWDDNHVYAPSIIFDGTKYHMWYSGFDGVNSSIGYATSPDGISWTRFPINLCPDDGDGCVLAMGSSGSWDEIAIYDPSVVYNGTIYQMWYAGENGSNGRIGYATSTDGINWTKYPDSPVLGVGQLGDWDEVDVRAPHVVYNGLTYTMWYGGIDNQSHARIGYATSLDGINWNKSSDNPMLDIGTSSGSWDEDWVTYPAVAYNGTQLQIWYTGIDTGGTRRIGLATAIYQSPGNLTSTIFDSGNNDTTWNFINWTEDLSPGTNITIATRTGNTSSPDTSWSNWSMEMWDETGSPVQPSIGRFIQYRATLTTTDQLVTPVLREVNINYSIPIPNLPPQIEVWEPGGSVNQSYTRGDTIIITWNTSDDNPLPLDPINITYGIGSQWATIAVNETDDGNYTWDTSTVPCPGMYWMNISVYDSEGLTVFDVSNYSFEIICPTYPPVIDDIRVNPDPQIIDGEVTISANVTDADTDPYNLTVSINITSPDGSALGNYTMSYDVVTSRYFFTSTYDTLGEYTFVIWAGDDTGNWVTDASIFKIEQKPSEFNWKPFIALVFTLILLLYGLWVSHNRPVKFSGELRKDRQSVFMYSTLPFVIAEIFTGIASLMIDALRVPPIPGLGLAIDLIILFIGLSMITVFFTKGKSPETYDKEEESSTNSVESEE